MKRDVPPVRKEDTVFSTLPCCMKTKLSVIEQKETNIMDISAVSAASPAASCVRQSDEGLASNENPFFVSVDF